MDLPAPGTHPPPQEGPVQALALATLATLCLLVAAGVLGVACLCTRNNRRLAAAAAAVDDVERRPAASAPARRYVQPPSARPPPPPPSQQLTLVGHPGGEFVLGTASTSPRPRPDKKMCGTHQHTTTVWVEA